MMRDRVLKDMMRKKLGAAPGPDHRPMSGRPCRLQHGDMIRPRRAMRRADKSRADKVLALSGLAPMIQGGRNDQLSNAAIRTRLIARRLTMHATCPPRSK